MYTFHSVFTDQLTENNFGGNLISFRSNKPVSKARTPQKGIFELQVMFSFPLSRLKFTLYKELMSGTELPFSWKVLYNLSEKKLIRENAMT